jgi:hypothetical protein
VKKPVGRLISEIIKVNKKDKDASNNNFQPDRPTLVFIEVVCN